METLETLEQFMQIDPVQFEELIERLEIVANYQKYISDIQLAILGFIAVACGILLANIFSRYIRG